MIDREADRYPLGIVRKHLKVEFFGRSHEDMTAYLVDAFLEGFTQKVRLSGRKSNLSRRD